MRLEEDKGKFVGRECELRDLWTKIQGCFNTLYENRQTDEPNIAAFAYNGSSGSGKSHFGHEVCLRFMDESQGVLDPRIVPAARRVCVKIDFDHQEDQKVIDLFSLSAEQAVVFYTLCGLLKVSPRAFANNVLLSAVHETFVQELKRITIEHLMESIGNLLRARCPAGKGDPGWSAVIYHIDEMRLIKDKELQQAIAQACYISSIRNQRRSLTELHKVFPVFIFTGFFP